jgi:hypothetical protein
MSRNMTRPDGANRPNAWRTGWPPQPYREVTVLIYDHLRTDPDARHQKYDATHSASM